MDERAASGIRLCLAKNVLANVGKFPSAKQLWERIKNLYRIKSISNHLYLQEQFHTLRTIEGTEIFNHLSVLNGIVTELETIRAKLKTKTRGLGYCGLFQLSTSICCLL